MNRFTTLLMVCSLALALAPISIQAQDGPQNATPEIDLEENKALVRQWLQDVDASRGSLDFIDKWMTPDFQTRFNSPDAMDLAGYRQFMSTFLNSFSEMRHEIHYMVAENDLVAGGITLRMMHTGAYEGIAPSGRPISIELIVVVRLRDGKIVEEWVVFDSAGLQQQLEASAAAPQ